MQRQCICKRYKYSYFCYHNAGACALLLVIAHAVVGVAAVRPLRDATSTTVGQDQPNAAARAAETVSSTEVISNSVELLLSARELLVPVTAEEGSNCVSSTGGRVGATQLRFSMRLHDLAGAAGALTPQPVFLSDSVTPGRPLLQPCRVERLDAAGPSSSGSDSNSTAEGDAATTHWVAHLPPLPRNLCGTSPQVRNDGIVCALAVSIFLACTQIRAPASHNNYTPASVDVATQVIITATVPGSGGSIGAEARVDIVPWGCGHLIGDASGPALPVPAGLPLPYMRAAAGGSAETAAAARAAEAQAVLML
jgi:hypothetical protein